MKFLYQSIIYCRTKVVEFWTKKLNIFYRCCAVLLALLWVIRVCVPSVLDNVGKEPEKQLEEVIAKGPDKDLFEAQGKAESISEKNTTTEVASKKEVVNNVPTIPVKGKVYESHSQRTLHVAGNWHKVYGVASYEIFGDLQDTQIVAAMKNGIRPPKNRDEAEKLKSQLVFVGGSPYYHIDEQMTSSQPYLVPRASDLLDRIGRNFFDSLYVKHLPLHKIIVSSVWRTEADVASLSRFNPNATKQSCHLYATTIDISYVRFHPVPAPRGRHQRTIGDDVLKYVLSEVLRDLRDEGACYVKHERKMPCFHITVR